MVRALAALGFLLLAGADNPTPVLRRIPADEARQGVASDGRYVYAVDNSRIGKYRIADGAPLAEWQGDPAVFPHLNSCAVIGRELACASSNYPALPQSGSVEFFDLRTLRHLRSHEFGETDGSLTAIDWYRGSWWAVFAQYDGKGGVPGKDHRDTQLVKLDRGWRVLRRWTFPSAILERIRPHSISGASWSDDGRLAVSGHDLPEIYIVALPPTGAVLSLVETVPVETHGQAIDWDPASPRRLWSISRQDRALVLSDIQARDEHRHTTVGTFAQPSSR
jgi:hypothetical protein